MSKGYPALSGSWRDAFFWSASVLVIIYLGLWALGVTDPHKMNSFYQGERP